MGIRLIVAMLMLAMAAGCSGEPRETSTASKPPVATPTSSPSPTEATPQQLASVIAKHEADWREVIDGAGSCRMLWVTQRDDPAESANRMSCFIQETTIGLTAQTAIRDLGQQTPPSSMSTLVNETTAALQAVADADLEAPCGSGSEPAQSTECNKAMGARMWTYMALETALDSWRPYL